MSSRVDRVNRVVFVFLGIVLVAAGATALVLSFGAYGDDVATEPVKPVDLTTFIEDNPWFWWAVAALVLIVGLLALRWLVAQLQTSRLARLPVETEQSDGETMVRTGAIADAVEQEVEGFLGVRDADMRVLGSAVKHRHRLTVDLDERADVESVRSRLLSQTVPNIRRALDFEQPAIDVRLVLSSRERRRVS